MTRRKLLTPAEYADHRRTRGLPGGTRQAVHKAIVDGRIQMLRGRIDADVADAMWGENSDAGDAPSGAPATPEQATAGSSYNTARTAHTRIRARISDLEYRRLARELVPAADVKAQLFEFGRKVREALLALGPRVAPLLAGAKTRAERERIITAQTRRICEDLAIEPDQVRENAG